MKYLFLFFLTYFSFNSFSQNKVNDRSVNYVIPPIYESIGSFHEGLASVKINHKWGFIDKTGKVVIEPQFNPWQAQFNSFFSDGLVAVNYSNGKDSKADIDGNNVNNVKWGFADKNGILVIAPSFMGDYFRPPHFKEGLASVISSSMFPNSQMLLTVSAKYGYIDKKGEFIIKPIYNKAYDFNEGLAVVEVDGKEGIIDKIGNFFIQPIYDTISNFSEGLAVASLDGKYFFIGKNGSRISDKTYEHLNTLSEGLARFSVNDKYGFVDRNENIVIKPTLPSGSLLSNFGRGYFSDGLYCIEYGNSESNSYDSGKFGYIDKRGKIVINPKFDSANDFKNGKAIVEVDNKSYFINKKGQRISPFYSDLSYESDGLVKVGIGDMLNRKYGFINY